MAKAPAAASLPAMVVVMGCSLAYGAEPGTGPVRRVGSGAGIEMSRFALASFLTELSKWRDLILFPRKDFLHALLHVGQAR